MVNYGAVDQINAGNSDWLLMMSQKKKNLKKKMRMRKIKRKKIRMMLANLLLRIYRKGFKNCKKELIKKFPKRLTFQK